MNLDHVKPATGYIAYVLDEPSRQLLAGKFPPQNPDWIGHHITWQFGVKRDPNLTTGVIQPVDVVGYCNADGIEALVVSIRGSTARPDGRTLHITWSIDRSKGIKPVDSNKVISERGYVKLDPIAISTTLEFLK